MKINDLENGLEEYIIFYFIKIFFYKYFIISRFVVYGYITFISNLLPRKNITSKWFYFILEDENAEIKVNCF